MPHYRNMLPLFRILSRLPLRLLHALGGLAGWLTYLASKTYRRRYQANVRVAGLPWSAVRGGIAEAGRMIAELPWLWLRPADQPLADTVRWEGGELIQPALAHR